MRCLALASALSAKGARIAFCSSEDSVSFAPRLGRDGWQVIPPSASGRARLPTDWTDGADAVVLDDYTSTIADEQALRAIARHVMVVEDLPLREHDCDILLDAGLAMTPAAYSGRVPAHCLCLTGPRYALLRPEFAASRSRPSDAGEDRSVSRVLVSMGLTDVGGVSARIVDALLLAHPTARIDVVIGHQAPSLPRLRSLAAGNARVELAQDVDNMADRMARADLAIGAGGGTALERCAVGLPSIIVILADNQRELAGALARAGAAFTLEQTDISVPALSALLGKLTPPRLADMARKARGVTDGRGAERVAEALIRLCLRAIRSNH